MQVPLPGPKGPVMINHLLGDAELFQDHFCSDCTNGIHALGDLWEDETWKQYACFWFSPIFYGLFLRQGLH